MKIMLMKWLMPLPTIGSNSNVGFNFLVAGLGRGPAPASREVVGQGCYSHVFECRMRPGLLLIHSTKKSNKNLDTGLWY